MVGKVLRDQEKNWCVFPIPGTERQSVPVVGDVMCFVKIGDEYGVMRVTSCGLVKSG